MKLIMVDPRALKENPDQDAPHQVSHRRPTPCCSPRSRRSASSSRPVISPEQDGGNGYVHQSGHRRVAQAIAADLEEIAVLVADLRRRTRTRCAPLVENVAREPLNPVDLWRSIERLVALGWTEESIAHRARLARAPGPQASTSRQRPAGDARPDGQGRYARANAAAHHRCRDSTRNRARSGRNTSRGRPDPQRLLE